MLNKDDQKKFLGKVIFSITPNFHKMMREREREPLISIKPKPKPKPQDDLYYIYYILYYIYYTIY